MFTRFGKIVWSLTVLILTLPVIFTALGGTVEPDIRPGKGVTGKKMLSRYCPALKNTNFDTPIYFLQGRKPGATGLVIGGTHANELAGQVAAQLIIENTRVETGRLIVMPYANRSALSVRDSVNKVKALIEITTRSGLRQLRYGNRRTDLKDQKREDPKSYKNPSGYVLKDGSESRNLNRAYPGDIHGSPTERLAYAVIAMIRKENADFCIDFHEARTPMKNWDDASEKGASAPRLAYTLVAHPKGTELAAFALLAMEEDTGITMKLEESNPEFRGLSHLEIGEATGCLSFLSESPNPGQDKWRTDPDVVHDEKYPLVHRVGIHLRVLHHLADAFSDIKGKPFVAAGIPGYGELMKGDIGRFFN